MAFEALLARRAAREPLAYITGRKEFWSLDFAVGPGVLVPRPETETLIEEALKRLPRPHRAAPHPRSRHRLGLPPDRGPARVSERARAGRRSSPRRSAGRGATRDIAGCGRPRANSRGRLGGGRRRAASTSCSPIRPISPPPSWPALAPELGRHEPRAALRRRARRARGLSGAGPAHLPGFWRRTAGRFVEIGHGTGAAASARCSRPAGLEIVRIMPDLAGYPALSGAAAGGRALQKTVGKARAEPLASGPWGGEEPPCRLARSLDRGPARRGGGAGAQGARRSCARSERRATTRRLYAATERTRHARRDADRRCGICTSDASKSTSTSMNHKGLQ